MSARKNGRIGLSGLLAVLASATQMEGAGGGGSSSSGSTSTSPYVVDVYDASKACNGTTFFSDIRDPDPRLVEVDMDGNIVWEYIIPSSLNGGGIGPDLEYLAATDTILFISPDNGVYEIDRAGNILWSHLDSQVSHDVDRLPNGNTLYCFGHNDLPGDAQVKEVDPAGNVVWSWSAGSTTAFGPASPYWGTWDQGYTHANAVTRLPDETTLISLRNFNLTVIVDSTTKEPVWQRDWTTPYGSVTYPHEPELLPGNRLLIALPRSSGEVIVETDMSTGSELWSYTHPNLRSERDADRLLNGNTLIQGVALSTADTVIIEVNSSGQIVCRLRLTGYPANGIPGYFYKAQRVEAALVPTVSQCGMVVLALLLLAAGTVLITHRGRTRIPPPARNLTG